MQDKDSDIFELTRSPKDINIKDSFFEDENPFISMATKRERNRHINDYDYNILKEDAYKDIEDDIFKLEYKISLSEEEMRNIESQINALKQINDYNKVQELQYKLGIIKEDYQKLLLLYNDKTLSAKITDSFSTFVEKTAGNKWSSIKLKFANTFESIVSKMPKKFSAVFRIRKSLSALENINQSVDKLVKMTIPYGENINKYQQLSKYIIRANSIQSEISEYMNNDI